MNAAIIFDRDNTLIHNDGDLGDPKAVRLCEGAAIAIATFRGMGYKIVVVTNQGGVARGRFTCADVEAVHHKINELLKAEADAAIDRFYYCPYHPQGTVPEFRSEHPWRKPKPGMLHQAAKDLGLDLQRSWVIGDQARDIQAGAAAGAWTIWLSADHQGPAAAGGPDRGKPATTMAVEPDYRVSQLRATIPIIRANPGAKPVHVTAAIPKKGQDRKPVGSDKPDRQQGPSASETDPPPGVSDNPSRTDVPDEEASGGDSMAPTEASLLEATTVPVEQSLREILQELRNQRAVGNDFSYTTVLAIVLQMVAVVCLLGAHLLSGDSPDAFLRWIGTGLWLELATIVVLLLRRT